MALLSGRNRGPLATQGVEPEEVQVMVCCIARLSRSQGRVASASARARSEQHQRQCSSSVLVPAPVHWHWWGQSDGADEASAGETPAPAPERFASERSQTRPDAEQGRIRQTRGQGTHECGPGPVPRACLTRGGGGGWSPCVTFRPAAVSFRGPGQSPVLPFACCVGLLLSVGRCGRCSC